MYIYIYVCIYIYCLTAPLRCHQASAAGVESVFDLMDMDDEDRDKLLGMTGAQLVRRTS